MLALLPRHLPPLELLLDDLANPAPATLARSLGVSTRTVYRWMEAPATTPRSVLAALYWLSRWGRDAIYCDGVNRERLAQELIRCQRGELAQARRELARVLRLGSFGSANDPIHEELPQGHTQQHAQQRREGVPAVHRAAARPVDAFLAPRQRHAGP